MSMDKKKMAVYAGIAVLGLGLTGFLATSVVPRVLVSFTKAAPATKVSIADSYLLADRILAAADGSDEAKVNVYVMDKSGKGVANKTVQLTGMDGIEPEVGRSSAEGKVGFRIKSSVEGQFEVSAVVEGVTLPRSITVTFRN